jgi:ATP-binding cassette subfamily B protein
MGVETGIQLRLARRVTTTMSVGSVIGGVAITAVYVLLGEPLLDGKVPLQIVDRHERTRPEAGHQ